MNQKLKLAAAALAGMVATVAAGGIAFASMDHGLGHLRGVDANNDGQITRAEWLATAGSRFDVIDSNKDGKLVVGEIPAAPHGERHHHGDPGHGRPGPDEDALDRDDAGGPPAPAASANATVPAAE